MFVVAGGAGKTGRAVADALLARGEEVRALVRSEQAAALYRARAVDARVLALEDQRSLTDSLRGAEALYALLPEELHSPDFRDKRSAITAALVAAVREAAVPRVVFLSARAAALSGANGHAADLHAAEKALANVSVLTTLRAACFQDNLVSALGMARESGLYLNFFPEYEPIAMVATRDVARCALEALLHPSSQRRVIDVVGPAYAPQEIASTLSAALGGKSVRVVDVAPRHQVSALREAGLSQEGASALVQLLACVSRPELLPAGDDTFVGSTTLSSTLRAHLHLHTGPVHSSVGPAASELLS